MITKLKLSTLLRRLEHPEQAFTFSRWGDGEWRSVLGAHREGAANCDRHTFYPEMGQELRKVLQAQPGYLLGMQNFAMRLYGKRILQFLEQHQLQRLDWIDADVFHYGAIKGQLDTIIQAVARRKLLVAGPPHLKRLKQTKLPYWKFVEVPPRNNFLSLDDTYRRIVAAAEEQTEPLLISLSAGMPAEILCDRLFDRFGTKHTIIDFGSLWDPLVGVRSRSYMKSK